MMGLFRTANLVLSRLFTSSSSRYDPEHSQLDQSPSGPTSFDQFSRLPVELRLKIWSFAAPSRILRVHLHEHCPSWIDEEERWAGYAPDPSPDRDSDSDQPTTSSSSNLPRFIPGPDEPLPAIPLYPETLPRPHHMVITPCSASHPCGCEYYPVKSHNLLPLPGVLLACHESRDALWTKYRRCLEEEYDAWGHKVPSPTSRFEKSPPSEPPARGLIINPSADILHVGVNVASHSSVLELSRFAAIVAQQIPDIQRILLSLRIAMPPYKFWASARYQYWQSWGKSGWWVPARHLIKMPALREVLLVARKKEKMLPVEWRARTEGQWVEELLKVEDQWPTAWEGRMPSLNFVDNLEEV